MIKYLGEQGRRHGQAQGQEDRPPLSRLGLRQGAAAGASRRCAKQLRLRAHQDPRRRIRATSSSRNGCRSARRKPDYVILWGWGVMNPTALKTAAQVGFPRDKMLGVWWAGSEEDVIPAGDAAKGYITMTFNTPGNYPVLRTSSKKVYAGGKGNLEDKSRSRLGLSHARRDLRHPLVEAIRKAQEKYGKGKVMTRRAGALGPREPERRRSAAARRWARSACSRRSRRQLRGPRRLGRGQGSSSGTARACKPLTPYWVVGDKEMMRKMVDESRRPSTRRRRRSRRATAARRAEAAAARLLRGADEHGAIPHKTPCNRNRAAAAPYLSVNNIEVIYDHVILVLKGVSLEVPEGRIVALLGANGAGKSTTLKAISTCCAPSAATSPRARSSSRASASTSSPPNALVRMGVCQVMEGRHCFAHLTVEENLLTGAFTRKASRAEIARGAGEGLPLFPAAQAAAREPGGLHLGRRAADDRDRPRADGRARR